MKVDATVHAMYPVDENQGASGTTPAAPARQPRIYPTDPQTQSGAKPGGEGGLIDRKKEPAAGAGEVHLHALCLSGGEGDRGGRPADRHRSIVRSRR